MTKVYLLFTMTALALCGPAMGQFIDDDFNLGVLGAQWTQVDSNPPGSTFTLTGSALQITAKEGSDFWGIPNDHAYVQQNAPTGTNWEVVTKIDNFDPRVLGFKRTFIRTGIQLWQDDDHWLSVGVLGNADGTDIGIQAFWQTDPTAAQHNVHYFGNNDLPNVTTSPIYLKLQKTPKGYTGFVSGDGSTWLSVLPLLKNPETIDGSFTNEKIRLYQSGGPPSGTGVSSPADFDYVHSATITAPVTGYEDDEFAGGAPGPKWIIYPGFREGVLSVGSGVLSMTSGAFQDQWEHVDRAMHVYQDAPTSASFAVMTKAAPTNLIPFEQWLAYGIMLWQDQCNWIMISNQRSETGTNRLEVAFKRAGVFTAAHADLGSGALPEYLQIEKSGGTYTPRYSFDNLAWTSVPAGGFLHSPGLRNAQVRLFAKRVFDTGPVPTIQFDWLHSVNVATAAADWQLLE